MLADQQQFPVTGGMQPRSLQWRKTKNGAINAIAIGSAAIGIFFLGWILLVVLKRGAAALDWTFLTKLPEPPGVGGGGMKNAILGTLMMTIVATVIGVPAGTMAGVYMNEYGHRTRFGAAVRFTVNMMMGIPSIIMGLFVYTLMVKPMGHFSGYAGGVALALLIMPIVARTTEDMLMLVPSELREAALALGVPRWRVTLGIIFRQAKTGIITGVLLAVARVSGETAPLLFTALNNPYMLHPSMHDPLGLNEPTGNLTVTIFNYAMSPYEDWQQAAWGASLLIMGAVLVTTIVTRVFTKEARR